MFVLDGASITEGYSRALEVTSDSALPKQKDVVIIGGGITGACAALCLAERGLSVAICEKGVIAGEASGRALGKVTSQYLSPAFSEMLHRAKELWGGLNERVNGDTGYQQTGLLSLCKADDDLSVASSWMQSVRDAPGFDPVILSQAESNSLSGVNYNIGAGALYTASDAIAEPKIAASVIAEGARAQGATIHQNCAVRGIETSAGAVSAVITEQGRIKTNQVILAGGAWSTLFCRSLGLDLPQLRAFASAMSIAPLANGPGLSGGVANVGWRNEADGGYSVAFVHGVVPLDGDLLRYGIQFLPALKHMWREASVGLGSELYRTLRTPSRWSLDSPSPFERVRILQPVTRDRLLNYGLERIAGELPVFKEAIVRDRWAGVLVTTPDNMPILSTVDEIPGLVLGTGLYFGLTMAPAAGELLADLVTGQETSIDPHPYRYQRFSDSTKLAFESRPNT